MVSEMDERGLNVVKCVVLILVLVEDGLGDNQIQMERAEKLRS